jgi:hypothetical protein
VAHVPVISLLKQKQLLLLYIVSDLRKPSSLGFKPRTDFQSCSLCSCILPTRTNCGFSTVLFLCIVSKLQKPSSLEVESRTYFHDLTFVPVILLLKQTTLVSVLFF